ncbi:MAG: hypothetical protein M0P16_08125 [Syntrophales bacterium]|nr:hypothetical protein [Syntrophales bacterium]
MIRIKYILQNMNVVNGLLAIAAAAMVYYIVIPFFNPDIRVSLPAVKETKAESYKITALPQNISQADYAVIGDQNLFHPERIVPPEKKEEKAIPKPEVILYGTLITDQLSIAFVEDRKAPRTTPGRGKRQMALHKGDQLSGYILREIEANRIVFTKGEEKIVVRLEEGEKRKASETPISPATTGMTPGSPQATASPASSPSQSPGQKAAQTSTSYLPTIVSRETKGGGSIGANLPSRRTAAQMEVIRKREAYRQLQGP